MKSFTALAALLAVVPAFVNAALTINTPSSVVQCEPTQLTWSDGTPPYFLSIIPEGQTSASPLKDFGEQQGTSLTWDVDLAANTNFNLALKDSTGNTVYSSAVTVQTSSNSSCVDSTVTESGGSTGSASATGGSSATSTSSSSGSPSSSGSHSSSGTSTGTSSSSSSTSSKSSAAGNSLSASAFGLAGVMGFIGAALL